MTMETRHDDIWPDQLPSPLRKFLFNRGIDSAEKLNHILNPRLKDLRNPFLLDQMDLAVARLISAFQAQETIAIYGDYDLDGTPAVALLQDGFKKLGFDRVETIQASRFVHGYGVHKEQIDELKSKNVSLVVTVDVGITDVASIAHAQSIGMDCIVTDHHLPKEALPKAVAIVNPNKGTCQSGLNHLCGSGVAFYLLMAFRMEMRNQNLLKQDVDLRKYLDLVALATVTDMVPLVEENRALVKVGLDQLAKSERPGIKALLQALGLTGKTLRAQDIGFRIAPKLNALTRIDSGLTALQVLNAGSHDAHDLVAKTLAVNESRTHFQKSARLEADRILQAGVEDDFVWIFSKHFHPGIVSLLASDLSGQFHRPAFVGSLDDDGTIVGSARAGDSGVHLQKVLSQAQSALIKSGGHAAAAGFELELGKAENFAQCLREILKDKNAAMADTSKWDVDAVMKMIELDTKFMNWYDDLGPYGMGFEAPKLALAGVTVKSVRTLKGSMLKYTLTQNGMEMDAPWFSQTRHYDPGTQVDVMFEPQRNEFRGQKSLQLIVKDMRLHGNTKI
jgi:single-stranded-DNA-specific exonuclease